MITEKPKTESEKYRYAAKKYKKTISYQIHKLEKTPKYGWQDTLVFTSVSLDRTKAKAGELHKHNCCLIVTKIDPIKQQARWIYTTNNIEKEIGKYSQGLKP